MTEEENNGNFFNVFNNLTKNFEIDNETDDWTLSPDLPSWVSV